ncbi:thioredoxin-like protein [Jimgerdemannia flammicorona]|uniref:Glutathione peroxidase n=1 Tax=Jimgerdemannia flammicorona TaxID=994334 RepID=A0A433QXX7_9FUNG|nr:thioredoxin-like protein [Jimgerdemannia flammicorona]
MVERVLENQLALVIYYCFPCNKFGNHEPGSNEEIKTFVAKYNTKFQMMDKIDVDGSNEHPLYTYLKSQLRGTLIDAIRWNFTKFIVDRNGIPIQRFGPKDEPNNMVLLERLLDGEHVNQVLDGAEPPKPAAYGRRALAPLSTKKELQN